MKKRKKRVTVASVAEQLECMNSRLLNVQDTQQEIKAEQKKQAAQIEENSNPWYKRMSKKDIAKITAGVLAGVLILAEVLFDVNLTGIVPGLNSPADTGFQAVPEEMLI